MATSIGRKNFGELDRMDIRTYSAPIGYSSILDGNGSAVGNTGSQPQWYHNIVGPNGYSSDAEFLNIDIFSAFNPFRDHMFALRNYVKAYMTPLTYNSANAGAYAFCGITIGETNSFTGGEAGQTQFFIQLRMNLKLLRFEAVFNNKYAGAGDKLYVVPLPPPFVITSANVGKSFLVEIDYWPNERVDYWINDKKVFSFTDIIASGIKGHKVSPIGDIFKNETTVSLTLSGAGTFAACEDPGALGGGGGVLKPLFANLQAITWRAPI